MRLEGRTLSVRMQPRTGADVKRLIRELVQLRYRINEPEQTGSIFGDTTHEAVAQFQRDHDLQSTGVVDEQTAARINAALDERRPEGERPFVLSGVVTRLGKPVPGVRVEADDQDLRSSERLGRAVTGADGRYEIRYGTNQFSRLEKGSADIAFTLTTATDVRVARFTARDAEGNVLALPLTRTPAHARIDIEIEDTVLDLSLYERLVADLAPLLGDVQVPDVDAANPLARLAEITPAEVEFLAREMELPPAEITVLVAAARAERQARARQRGVPGAAYYGLLRQGHSIEPAAILRAGRRGLSEALRNAIDGHVVPGALANSLESILTDLEEMALTAPTAADGTQLRIDRRLSETLADESRRRTFAKLAADQIRRPAEFWADLARQPGFEDPAVRERLETDLHFARVGLNHAPLVTALRALPGVRTVRDLVGLDKQRWIELMQQPGADGQPIGPPPSVGGGTEDERVGSYADAIVRALSTAYPNDAVANIVTNPATRIATQLREPVATFLRRADGFDIRHSDLDTYVREHPELLENLDEELRAQVTREVTRGQRLLSLTSGPQELSKVMATDIGSAYQVAAQGEANFTKKYGEILGVATAHAMHEKATQVTNGNVWLLSELRPQNVLNDPVALGSGVASAQVSNGPVSAQEDIALELPNVAKLFGANDACGCEHCRSIYGPAAYLVTLLQFLEHSAPNADGKTPYDVLTSRRPDIPAIPLTCANADTPMPMIDRVNEILEAYVASGALSEADAHDTGMATAADLAAAPQFTNPAAYVKLREASYARVLPFDDAWQVVGAHLTQLGASRAGIMELYGRGGLPSAVELACERLGIPSAEAPILTGSAGVSLATLLYPPGEEPADVVGALTPAREFLRRLELTFEQATAVLGTGLVNPTGQMGFASAPGADPCDVDAMTVAALNADALRRMLQLLRLQHRTGWTAQEIDRCLRSVNASTIDGASLVALDQIARLAAMFDRPPVDLVPLWSPLPTDGDESPYARVFLPQAIVARYPVFARASDGSVLSNASQTLDDNTDALAAALGVGEHHLATIRADAGLADAGATLSLESVSALYAYILLAELVELELDELIALKKLSGANVFAGPAEVLAFAELTREVAGSDMSVAALSGLIRAMPAGPQPEVSSALLRKLRTALARVEAVGSTGTVEQRVQEILAAVLPPDVANNTFEMITGAAVLTAPLDVMPEDLDLRSGLKPRVSFDSQARALRVRGMLTSDELEAAREASDAATYRSALDAIAADSEARLKNALAELADEETLAELLDGSSFDDDGAMDTVSVGRKLETLLVDMAAPARKLMVDRLVESTASEEFGLNVAMIRLLADTIAPQAFGDLRAAFDRGLSATYYYSAAPLGAPIGGGVDGALDGTAALGTEDAPHNTRSARWEGRLLPAADGEFAFTARASGAVKVWIDDLLGADGDGGSGDGGAGAPVRLTRSGAHRLRLEVTGASAPLAATLRWRSLGNAPSVVPADALVPTESFDRFQAAERRIRRLAGLISTLALTARALEAVWNLRADFGGLDVLLEPIDRSDAAAIDAVAPARLAQWRKLLRFALAQKRHRGVPDLVDVLTSPTVEDARQRLALLDRRDPALIAAIVGPEGLNLGLADLRRIETIERVRLAARLAARLGAPPALLFSLATQAPDADAAQAVCAVTRSAYDEDTWTAVSTAAQAILRVARRDALLGYLKPRLGLATDYDCLAYFYVDVQTGVEPPTSRIVEATFAIQHFVSLCLKGVVPMVSPEAIDADRWNKSLCYYRVQEAATRVFTDTPDFIEEPLRDDKSEFFREMESHVRQGELTEQRVEDAIRGYLTKLEAIARPQILAMCEDPTSGRLHLFARTTSEPPIYYHRWRERTGVWSGWCKLPLDIGSNQLIPVMWAGRLFLFWSLAEEARARNKEGKETDGKALGIRLAWSTLRGERWEAKRTMPREAALQVQGYGVESLSFNAAEVDGGLRVECAVVHGIGVASVTILPDPVSGVQHIQHTVKAPEPWWVVERIGWFEARDTVSPIRSREDAATFQVSDSRNFVLTALGESVRTIQLGSSGEVPILLQRSFGRVTFTSLHDPAQVRVGEVFAFSDDMASFLGADTSASDPETAYPLPGLGQYFDEYGDNQLIGVASSSTAFTPIPGAFISTRALTAIAQSRPAAPEFEPSPADLVAVGAASMQLAVASKGGAANVVPEPPLSFAEKKAAGVSGVDHAAWGVGTSEILAPSNSVLSVRFEPHYHPFAHAYALALDTGGPEGLFTVANQRLGDVPGASHTQLHFATAYQPAGFVKVPYPRLDVDFTPTGAYSLYNREIFFHIPALVLELATREGVLELAERYGEFVLDETPRSNEPIPERYWRFLPFKTASRDSVETLLKALHRPLGDPTREAVLAQIADWRKNPFQPHRIARSRLVAYMKYFFFKHLEHRIAKGDRPFRRRTLEFNNEASQVYLAAEAIARPVGEQVPAREPATAETYATLKTKGIDALANALVELESKFPFVGGAGGGNGNGSASLLDVSTSFYFCIPKSQKLQSYWNTIQNRLFNLRHGRDIDGIPQELPLFAPPIDPMLLVRAAAKGLTLSQVLDDLSAPPPNVRYRYALQQAKELGNQAIAFRQALIHAEERREAEELTALLASQHGESLKAIRVAKSRAVDSVREEIKALRQSLRPVQREFQYYRDIEMVLPYEKTQLQHLERANQTQRDAGGAEVLGQELNLLPTLTFSAGPPSTSFGGSNLGAYAHAIARGLTLGASEETFQSTRAGIIGALLRTQGEWALRRDVAQLQIAQIERQISAREIQAEVDEAELDAQVLEIEHAQALLDFHRDKTTSAELYGPLAGEARHVLGRMYKLARTWAMWAVRLAELERGKLRQSFDFPPLEDGRLDTMAPERLLTELAELDKAVHETNAYDYRLVKHVSLLLHDPLALIALKETGSCEFELPETLFDADYPGHYDRRLKSVSVTIPCVVGPYVGINATLTLLWSKTRVSAEVGTKYQEGKDDRRFTYRHVPRRAIALSTGQNDDGMPELQFDDRQDEYGPIENAGAICRCRVELARDCNAFDIETLSDVILRLIMVAREGGALLRAKAREAVVQPAQKGLVRLFSLKHEFPNAWQSVMSPPSASAAEQAAELTLDRDRFSMRLRTREIKIKQVEVFIDFKEQSTNEIYLSSSAALPLKVAIGGTTTALTLDSVIAVLGGMPCGRVELEEEEKLPNTLRIAISADDIERLPPELRSAGPDPSSPPRLNRERLNDILVLVRFDAE